MELRAAGVTFATLLSSIALSVGDVVEILLYFLRASHLLISFSSLSFTPSHFLISHLHFSTTILQYLPLQRLYHCQNFLLFHLYLHFFSFASFLISLFHSRFSFYTFLIHGIKEGFLIGSIVRKSEQVLLDASHTNNIRSSGNTPTHTTQTTQYVLRHFLVTGSSGSFYDQVGNVNPDSLRSIVRKSEQDGHRVIGWFRARRHSSARLTLRESAVWRSILKLGPRHGHHDIFTVDPLLALFAVTPQSTTNALTFDYRFLDPGVGGLDPCICNLGSSSAIEYRELSVTWAGAGGMLLSPLFPLSLLAFPSLRLYLNGIASWQRHRHICIFLPSFFSFSPPCDIDIRHAQGRRTRRRSHQIRPLPHSRRRTPMRSQG